MSSFVIALGLVLVIEGLIYACAPNQLKQLMAGLRETSPESLRTGGLMAMAAGLMIVWLARRFLEFS